MLRKVATAAAVLCFGVSAFAAGFDGRHLTTNDWFDADFTTGIEADTAIESGSTTGITRGAGSWTAVPATGTAKVVADSDAGGEAKMLAINAPGEELTFTPSAPSSATGMETSSLLVKGDAVDELPELPGDVQAAFAIYDDGTAAAPCGYTAAGWTNLEYSGAMSGLTNAWCTVYVDFANVAGVRYVRYSVEPADGDVTVLAAGGETWFQAASNATTITSLSLSGVGSCRTINGDSLEETVSYVAAYNDASYETVAAAIAVAVADEWANGNVTLLDDATWAPTATGTYNIDVAGHELTINGASGTWSGTKYTVKTLGTVYRAAWVQDFEDVATYASNLKEGSVASAVLGTSASTPKDLTYTVHEGHYEYVDSGTIACQLSQEERTAYDYTSSHCLRGTMRGATSANLMFMMPSEATTATDYVVEFDHYLGPSYSNGSNVSSNGFVIVGANGILASFAIGPVSSGSSYQVGVYRGDDVTDVLTTSIVTGSRGSVDEAAYWMHVTVRGTAEGVFMSVANADGRSMSEVKLQNDFDVVEAIFVRNTAKQYKHGFSLDDVVVSLPTTATTYTWTGAAGDGFWTTAGNWLVGGDHPLAAPTAVDDVVIPSDSGDVCISPDVAYGSLTIGGGARLALLVCGVTEEATVFTLPELRNGSTLSADQVVLRGPYAKGVTGDGTAVTATRVPSTFSWAVSSGAWQLPSNWTVGGLASGDTPGSEDLIVFPSTATCVVNTTSLSVSNVIVNANAALTVTGSSHLYALVFKGEGSLRLDGGLIGNVSGKHGTISNDIEVVEGTTNDILVGNGGGYQISFYGNLSGSGSLRIDENGQNSAGLNLYSEDNSAFAGSFEVYRTFSSAVRSNTRFFKAGATSSNAVWKLRGNGNSNIFQESNKTYYFGALNNGIYEGSSYSGIVLEIGARNEDCAFSGSASRSDDSTHRNYGTKIRKVGTAKLTIDTTNTGTVEINGGTFAFKQASALPNKNEYGDYWIEFGGGTLEATGVDPSALTMKSKSPISVFVGAETNEVWATALDASNVGGLTKKGEGTLTLTAVPLYTGLTTVEAGTLVVPTGTEISYNALSDTNRVSGATITNYAYAANTTLVAPSTSGSVVYDAPLDCSGLVTIDASGITLDSGEPYVIAEAQRIRNCNCEQIAVELPAGADASKWKLSVRTINGKRCLCLADFNMGTMLMLF